MVESRMQIGSPTDANFNAKTAKLFRPTACIIAPPLDIVTISQPQELQVSIYLPLLDSTAHERSALDSHETIVMSNACNSTDDDHDPGKLFTSTRDLGPQAVISVALGLFAFLTFCVSGVSITVEKQTLTRDL